MEGEEMKIIGVIGGMSWTSTVDYYRLINKMVKNRLGEPHSAEILMHSVDFARIEELQHQGRWQELAERLSGLGKNLSRAGADILLICANTMHKTAGEVEKAVDIPLLHIADCAGEKLKNEGFCKTGLLGTKFTMEQDFYSKRLRERYGIEVEIPEEDDRDVIHDIIYEELISDVFREESQEVLRGIIADMVKKRDIECALLACTELPLLFNAETEAKEESNSDEGENRTGKIFLSLKKFRAFKNTDKNTGRGEGIPLFDTTYLHADRAVDIALGDDIFANSSFANSSTEMEKNK